MPKPRRPAGAGEVGFDEQAHRPSLTRHPKLGAQATRDGRVDRACFLSCSGGPNGDRGGDEPILRPEGAQRVNRDHAGLTAEFEGRLGPGNADRTWKSPADTTIAGRSGVGSAAVRLVGCCGAGAWARPRLPLSSPPVLRARVVPRYSGSYLRPAAATPPVLPLLLDDSSLALQCSALLGEKLAQLRNRRVSTARRLRERGTGSDKQRHGSKDAEPNTIRLHRSVLLRRLQVRGRFERPCRRCDAPRGGIGFVSRGCSMFFMLTTVQPRSATALGFNTKTSLNSNVSAS